MRSGMVGRTARASMNTLMRRSLDGGVAFLILADAGSLPRCFKHSNTKLA